MKDGKKQKVAKQPAEAGQDVDEEWDDDVWAEWYKFKYGDDGDAAADGSAEAANPTKRTVAVKAAGSKPAGKKPAARAKAKGKAPAAKAKAKGKAKSKAKGKSKAAKRKAPDTDDDEEGEDENEASPGNDADDGDGELGVKTFARRYRPSREGPAARWDALKEAFINVIRPKTDTPSKHEARTF